MGNMNVAFSLRKDAEAAESIGIADLDAVQTIRARYPHVAQIIEQIWGTREMDVYFDRLVVKDREERSGFPPEIMAAILNLSAMHVKQFGFEPFDSYDDIWDPFVKHAHRASPLDE